MARTVECLRGRLLAERQASKTANEDARLMENKLLELENKLKEETKLKTKAEKRLRLLKKKLESLKILPDLEDSEQSSSSQNYASCSSTKFPEISQNVEEKGSDTKTLHENSSTNSSSSHEAPRNDYFSSSSLKTSTNDSSYENSSTKSSSSHEFPKIDYTSSSSLKASTLEINKMNGKNDDDDCVVDNSLALVPMKLPENKVVPEVKIVGKSICEVLDNLRHARERIQNSMGRRQMIRVGPF